MIDPEQPPIDRLAELLADLALQGLSNEERTELEGLTEDLESDRLAFEAVVAEFELAQHEASVENLPVSLRQRIERDAHRHLARSTVRLTIRKAVVATIPWLGWVAAAAILFVPGPFFDRKALELPIVERLASVKPLKLASTDHPLARGAGGSLGWSGERQEGYLSIQGLAEVEADQGVYQLWIFDSTRDDRYPVDGGTFTIADARQTTLVPIHPSIPVRSPTLFAVTLEPAGGVVVSDRKRILLKATP